MRALINCIIYLVISSNTYAGWLLTDEQVLNFSQGRYSLADLVSRDRAVNVIKNFLVSAMQSPPDLALTDALSIYDSANVVGVDPMNLAVLMKEYTDFVKDSLPSSNRFDTLGLVGFNELKRQYGVLGENYHSKGMNIQMREQLARRFESSEQQMFLNALQLKNSRAGLTILRNNPDFMIFSTAQLLKLSFVIKRGLLEIRRTILPISRILGLADENQRMMIPSNEIDKSSYEGNFSNYPNCAHLDQNKRAFISALINTEATGEYLLVRNVIRFNIYRKTIDMYCEALR